MDKKELEREVRKMRKKDSYNKKALEISKEVLRKLYYKIDPYKLYPYFELLEILEEEMKIVMDYSILCDAIKSLEKEGNLLRSTNAVYYIEN